ncbi:response regulator transcription factor [Brevibacterium sp. BRM-1]|uniref:response regulator transcription factor n=1 Tax=Brevibacterium sp. BRM-1 TaxID=2999062 RepID=UPI00227E8F63|nr:response regulator transcription factor [Brevibacterium sp. BRM-1]WAL41559.1 response regulator transcription factor [Brevibacterium sp. BRM-1]
MSESGPPIRVIVADDQAIVREGLATVLGLLANVDVVGQAADGAQALAIAREVHPDVVLMDLRMPGVSGAEATALLRAQAPSVRVLVLTTFGDDASIAEALRAGAAGYLTKDASRAQVAAAIRAVAAGATAMSDEVGARLLQGLAPAPAAPVADGSARPARGDSTRDEREEEASPASLRRRHANLTAREAEVLALMAQGLTNAEIAGSLFVSMPTVKTHVNAVFAKLPARDRADAIRQALGRGRTP